MEIQWSLVLFTALTGLAGWLFFFVCLNALLGKTDKGAFAGSVAALVLAIVGGCASVTHLSHPDRMLNALQHPTSGIFTEAVLVGLLCLTIAVFLVLLKRSVSGAPLKGTAAVGMVLGALMSFMAGQSYIMGAVSAWNTELLPLGYLGTAAASGAAAYLLLIAGSKASEEAVSFYGLCTLAAGIVAAVAAAAYAASAGVLASELMLYGTGAILCGGIIPAALGALAWKRPENALVASGCAFVAALAGSAAYRCGMWVVGVGLYGFFNML